jgi:hypothetical protein
MQGGGIWKMKRATGNSRSRVEAWSITDILQSLDKNALMDLMQHLLETEPEAYRLSLEWLKKNSTKVSDKKTMAMRLNDELLMEYWYNAEGIVSELNEYGGGPEEDEIEAADWLHKISELKEKGSISTEVKFEFLDKAFVQYDYGNSGLDDALMEAFFGICETKEEWEYLVEKLKKTPSRWRDKLIMDIQKEHLHDEKAYLDLRMGNLHYGMDYWDLVMFYQEKKDVQKALNIAEQGIVKGEGRCIELFQYLFNHFSQKEDTNNLERIVATALTRKTEQKEMLDRLFHYYKTRRNYEKAKENLLKAYEFVSYKGYYSEYKRMKGFLKKSDWELIEPTIIKNSKEKDIAGYLQICMDKNMKKTVVETILHLPNHQWGWLMEPNFDTFADQLTAEFPEKILEYYWKKTYSSIAEGKRGTYQTAGRYLNKIKRIYINVLKDESRWNQRFSDLKTEFKKRPAFLEEVGIILEGKQRSREYEW